VSETDKPGKRSSFMTGLTAPPKEISKERRAPPWEPKVKDPFGFRRVGDMPGAKTKERKIPENPGTPWMATSMSVPRVAGKPPPRTVSPSVLEGMAVFQRDGKGEMVEVGSISFEELLEERLQRRPGRPVGSKNKKQR